MFVYCLFWLKPHNTLDPNLVVTSVLVNAQTPKCIRQPAGKILNSKLPCHLPSVLAYQYLSNSHCTPDTTQNGQRDMPKSRVTSWIKWITLYAFIDEKSHCVPFYARLLREQMIGILISFINVSLALWQSVKYNAMQYDYVIIMGVRPGIPQMEMWTTETLVIQAVVLNNWINNSSSTGWAKR